MIRTALTSAWSHRRRLASTTFAIVLGIAFLAGTLVVRDTATSGFASAFGSANAGVDAVVRHTDDLTSDEQPRTPLDASLISTITRIDGIAATAPQVSGAAQILGADGKPIGGDGPPTIATNWITTPQLSGYHIATGRSPAKSGEVVIDARTARVGHLHVGSRTTANVPNPIAVTVVGIARFGHAESLGGATLVAFTLPEAQRLLLHDQSKVSSILVAARPGTSAGTLVRRLGRVVPKNTEAITGAALTAEQEADVQGDFLGFFTTALLAFAVIALLVATFSIFNTFTVLASQRTRESALLRAIGASRAQVLGAGLIEAVLVALCGVTLGIGGGLLIALGLCRLLGTDGLGLPIDGLVVSPAALLITVATGLIVTLGAALVPAVRAARIPPIAALRASAADGGRSSRWRGLAGGVLLVGGTALVLAATNGNAAMGRAAIGAMGLVVACILLGPFAAPVAVRAIGVVLPRRGVVGDLAQRNAGRNPRRTAGTAAALLVGVSVVSLFTVFGASIKVSMNNALKQGFAGDLVIEPQGGGSVGLSPAIAPQLAKLPEVGAAAALTFTRIRLDGAATDVNASDLAALTQVASIKVHAGDLRHLEPNDFGASTTTADSRHWRVGDRITAAFGNGQTESIRLAFTYTDRALIGDIAFPQEVVTSHVSQRYAQVVVVRYAKGADSEAARRAVTTITDRLGRPKVEDRAQFLTDRTGRVDGLLKIIYGLLAVAILIAGMGIANTQSLSVHERTRELGLLRAVGVSRRPIRAMVRWESAIVAAFGAVGGAGLGVFLGWGLIRALAASEGFGTFALPVLPLAVIVLLGAGIGVLAAIRPARRAARLDVLAAIAAD